MGRIESEVLGHADQLRRAELVGGSLVSELERVGHRRAPASAREPERLAIRLAIVNAEIGVSVTIEEVVRPVTTAFLKVPRTAIGMIEAVLRRG